MADLNNPELSSQARNATPPPSVNGTPLSGGRGSAEAAHDEAPLSRSLVQEIVLSGRWLAGLVVVFACGWGLIGLACYFYYVMTHETGKAFILPAVISGLLSLGIFLAFEYKQILSKFTGLRQFSQDTYGVKSALYLWALGVPGIVFRATGASESDAETQTATRPSVSPQEPQQTDGLREIIETVVFVVVLVLLLKSFAAEAFVIPTGSMAETLYGYQRIIKCPECGREFPVNCSSEVDPSQGAPVKITSCVCPGCRYHIDFDREEENNRNWKKPDWNSGDRVLVAKFLYELFNKRPNRLDVVVFKYPGDSRGGLGGSTFPASGPMKNHTPMNYIKRLIGLSGETIAIHRGKLYVLPPNSGIEYPDWKEAQTDEALRLRLWQFRYMHVCQRNRSDDDHCKELELFDQGRFSIIRKPPETMLDVRRLVYDNANQAKDLKGVLPPRWAGEGWQEDGTGFKTDAKGDAIQWLPYHHYLRDDPETHFRPLKMNDALTGKAPARSLITDFLGYNFYMPHGGGPPGLNWVGDLMLECEVVVDKTEGQFVMELSKSHDRFRLNWDLATGDMELTRLHGLGTDRKEEKLATKKATKPRKDSTYLLRFANFDDRLTVWVDGSLPFDDGVPYEAWGKQHPGAPEHAGPTKENDLEPASLGVKDAAVSVHKLALYRDLYYTAGNLPTDADASGNVDFCDPTTWGSIREGMPIKTLYVQPDHYLCLGDNSPESSDGRSWGLVPERLLLGRAMLVYYPFGRAGKIH